MTIQDIDNMLAKEINVDTEVLDIYNANKEELLQLMIKFDCDCNIVEFLECMCYIDN